MTPAPPKNADVANSTRNSTGSRPKYSPSPPATPAPTRSVRLRRRTRRRRRRGGGWWREVRGSVSVVVMAARLCRAEAVVRIGWRPDPTLIPVRSGSCLMRGAPRRRQSWDGDTRCPRRARRAGARGGSTGAPIAASLGGVATRHRRAHRRADPGRSASRSSLLTFAGGLGRRALRRLLDRAADRAGRRPRPVPGLARVRHRRRASRVAAVGVAARRLPSGGLFVPIAAGLPRRRADLAAGDRARARPAAHAVADVAVAPAAERRRAGSGSLAGARSSSPAPSSSWPAPTSPRCATGCWRWSSRSSASRWSPARGGCGMVDQLCAEERSRAHPLAGTRRHRRAPARLGAADARADPAQRRLAARGRPAGPRAGTRAAHAALRRPQPPPASSATSCAPRRPRSRTPTPCRSRSWSSATPPLDDQLARGRGGGPRGAGQRGQALRRDDACRSTPRSRPTQVSVFVKDRGVGFDLDAVADDRQGVRGSIIGRIERHGGTGAR